MTDGRSAPDMGRILDGWMAEVAPDRAPVRLFEESFARTMAAPQAQAYPWHTARWRAFQRPGSRPAIRVALVAMAAIIGVALVSSWLRFDAVGPQLSPTPGATPVRTPQPSGAPSLVTPVASVPVAAGFAMVSDGDAVWVMSESGLVSRIDPTANTVAASIQVGDPANLHDGLAINQAGLWVTEWEANLLYRLDPTSLETRAQIAVGPAPKGALATSSGVWVANTHGGTVARIDAPWTGVGATITVGKAGASGPNWLADGLGSIWTGVPNEHAVVRFDAALNTVQSTIPVPSGSTPCGGLAVSAVAVWITSCATAGAITRIDPAGNAFAASVVLGGNAYSPKLIDGEVWVSVATVGPEQVGLVRINEATNQIDLRLLPSVPYAGGGDIVVAAGSLWLLDGVNGDVLRLPLSALTP